MTKKQVLENAKQVRSYKRKTKTKIDWKITILTVLFIACLIYAGHYDQVALQAGYIH